MSNSAPGLDLAERIQTSRKEAGRSVQWLSDTTGIPYSTLRRKLLITPESFTVQDLSKIADSLGADFKYIAAGPRIEVAA